MNSLTNEQRLQIIEFYYQNACSVKKVHRALLPFYGRAIVTKLRTKFTLLDIKSPTRIRRVRTEENIAAVSASVNDDLIVIDSSLFGAIGPLLHNNVENFAEGFRCEAFQNAASASIGFNKTVPHATQHA